MSEQTLQEIASELLWRGKRMKSMPRMAENDELNDVLLNQAIDDELIIQDYINR